MRVPRFTSFLIRTVLASLAFLHGRKESYSFGMNLCQYRTVHGQAITELIILPDPGI
jgi:hypothetical protein